MISLIKILWSSNILLCIWFLGCVFVNCIGIILLSIDYHLINPNYEKASEKRIVKLIGWLFSLGICFGTMALYYPYIK